MSDSLGIVKALTTIQSSFGPKTTMDRLETEIRQKGMNAFARVDHAAGAAEVGLTLRSTELIIFGNTWVARLSCSQLKQSVSTCR